MRFFPPRLIGLVLVSDVRTPPGLRPKTCSRDRQLYDSSISPLTHLRTFYAPYLHLFFFPLSPMWPSGINAELAVGPHCSPRIALL